MKEILKVVFFSTVTATVIILFCAIISLTINEATILQTLNFTHYKKVQFDFQYNVKNTSANSSNASLIVRTEPTILRQEIHEQDLDLEGYIFPYSIFEEQTSGAKNLWQLQILAKQLEMNIVEPFARDSIFTMQGVAPNFTQALRFGDYFDVGKWNEMVNRSGGNPLVKWENFITKAPRRAVILHTMKTSNSRLSYESDHERICDITNNIINKGDMLWIKEKFIILKTVCYTNSLSPLSIRNFTSLLFSDHDIKSNQITLFIAGWIGIRNTRVHLQPLSLFSPPSEAKLTFPPSQRVMRAYGAYVDQFIGNHKYVGIVFRTHHVLQFSPLTGSFAEQSKHLLLCSKNLSSVLDKVRDKWKIFLAYDMGMFGSKKYASKAQLTLRDQIFLDVFNGSQPVHVREQSLKRAARGTTDRGLIAQLEKVIVTNADCVISLGRHSNFVKSAVRSYIELHKSDRCIVSICSDNVYDNHVLISSSTIPDSFISK